MVIPFILMLNSGCAFAAFLILKKKRSVIHKRLERVLIGLGSSVMSLAISMNVQLWLHVLAFAIYLSVLFGVAIGVVFGLLDMRQLMMIGYQQGLIGGLMGAMLGAVVLNPSLCGLPAEYGNSIETHTAAFSFFSLFLSAAMVGLIYFINESSEVNSEV